MADDLDAQLQTLVVQSPADLARLVGLVRATCASALSLPPLPAEAEVSAPESDTEQVVAAFAEQLSVDVSAIGDDQRAALGAALGAATFPVVVQMFIADFLPRVRAGLDALGLPVSWVPDRLRWDRGTDATDVVFNALLPAVARLRALDPVTAEVVRLRGAAQHNCRLCKSRREGTALDAGGSETLYGDIERFEESDLLTEAQKAALRYVDALIWSPARIDPSVAAGVREHFTTEQARELTLDVLRNASNKIAVALKADAPRVEHGTERYLIDAEGQTQPA
ncbi:MAG: carboxymuconolactone decarboxylase family protein [Mycobacterium sp.]|nr:carboxymuconolactone decarboxylase family protein [Mycobacterium sp.]